MSHPFDVSPGGIGLLTALNPAVSMACVIRDTMSPGSPIATLDFNARVSYSVFSSAHDSFKVGLQFMKSSQIEVARLIRILGLEVPRPSDGDANRS